MSEMKNTKEGLDMSTISKPQEAIVVAKGMTKAFMDLLASQKISESYWEECSHSNKNLSNEEIEILKRMCNEEIESNSIDDTGKFN